MPLCESHGEMRRWSHPGGAVGVSRSRQHRSRWQPLVLGGGRGKDACLTRGFRIIIGMSSNEVWFWILLNRENLRGNKVKRVAAVGSKRFLVFWVPRNN